MVNAIGIIPARFASSRFPGKLLASLSGRPLIQHVYARARSAGRLSEVWVATDDRRIAEVVSGFGGRAVMTSPDHRTGTDRCAEAASRTEAEGAKVVVNIQGDQPLIAPEALDALVAAFDPPEGAAGGAGDPPEMATLYEPLRSVADLVDPNVAKVVVDGRHNALYFSRSPIPYYRGPGASMERGFEAHLALRPGGLQGYWKHVGVYAFRRDFLFTFDRLPRGPLEAAEGLEQLRALESGHRIRLVPSAGVSISVETPGDLARVQAIMDDVEKAGDDPDRAERA